MSYLDDYRSRINVQGSTVAEGFANQSKHIINSSFENSPSYYIVQINDQDVGVRLIDEDTSSKKSVLFRPDTLSNIGDLIFHKNHNWILTDFIDNDIFPKGSLEKCNYSLSINPPPTKTLKGHDSVGRPVYEETNGTPLLLPCIVETSFYHKDDKDTPIILPKGNIRVTLSYLDNSELKIGQTITVYNEKYKIVGVDLTSVINNIGIIKLNAEKV